jgi:hypothetical protein
MSITTEGYIVSKYYYYNHAQEKSISLTSEAFVLVISAVVYGLFVVYFCSPQSLKRCAFFVSMYALWIVAWEGAIYFYYKQQQRFRDEITTRKLIYLRTLAIAAYAAVLLVATSITKRRGRELHNSLRGAIGSASDF